MDDTTPQESPIETLKEAIASFEDLRKKPRRVRTVRVTLPADDDGVRVVTLKFQAIDPKRYDELVAAHPPVGKDKTDGLTWNPDTFPSALIAETSYEPKLSYDQVKELYTSGDWSSGELNDLFGNALAVSNQGLNVPFNDSV